MCVLTDAPKLAVQACKALSLMLMEKLLILTTNLLKKGVVCIYFVPQQTGAMCTATFSLFNLHCPRLRATALHNEMLDGGSGLKLYDSFSA